jgi:predicted ATPase
MSNRLERLTIKGFKTVASCIDFSFGSLTVLIGPNGAGKSNFVSFFRMLSWAFADPKNLRRYVGMQGGASTLLHDGPANTREVEAEITIVTDAGTNRYAFGLTYAAGDTFVFDYERCEYDRSGSDLDPYRNDMAVGGSAPQLLYLATYDTTARVLRDLLRRIVVYQFHNTSDTARVRGKWRVDDNRWLKEDAGNLAPVLLRLRDEEGAYYQRVVETIRLILPFFSDFELNPDHGSLLLQWRERDSDQIFGVSQAADGMLRAMALVTLLLQPEQDLPDVLIIDEPELGLHPYAVNIVGGLMRSLATRIQVVVATQSTQLIDCFEPNDIVVVERDQRRTSFRRLDADELSDWLKEYLISELWEKNVLGGRP